MRDRILMEIRVRCMEPVSVEGKEKKIVMIPFTGEASGPYFSGKTAGTGVDTQRICPEGNAALSARYMLEGKDSSGNACRVFIENEGSRETGFRPEIVTDSPVLAEFEGVPKTAEIEGIEGGVMVRIYLNGGGRREL